MVEVLAFDRLGPGHPRVEVTHRLEELGGDILLRDIDVGQFGAPEGRLVVYPSAPGSVGLRTDKDLFQNATVIKPGDRVGLVLRREFFNAQLAQSKGQLDIELTLKRFSPRNPDPPSKPLRLRVKIVSGSPPDVIAEVERTFAVSADVVDESDETVPIAVVGLRNAPARAPYEGAPVHLFVRTKSDGLSAALLPAASALLVRPYQHHGGAAEEAWVGLDHFTAIPLPLEKHPFLLEMGLPPAVLRDCLRAGGATGEGLGIGVSLTVSDQTGPAALQTEKTGAASKGATHELTLPVRFEGSPGDVFFFKVGNEQFRTILRSGSAPPTRTLARVHTARRRLSTGTELGLDPLIFDVSMLSIRSYWTVEPVATLVDHDAGKNVQKTLPPVILLGGPQPISVPLPEMAVELVTNGCHLEHAMLDVRFRLRNRDKEATADDREVLEMVVEIPVSVEGKLPAWLVCVDFGASAIAVAVARGEELYQMPARGGLLRPLPLGDWFRTIDNFHPEIVPTRQAASPSAASVLLPSYVGLSSSIKLRTMFDPVSYGDFEAMMEESVARRLEMLGCEYDVSVPYPSYDKLSDELGKIVFAIKRELVKGKDTLQMPSHVYALRSGVLERTTEIDIARLFGDCCRELGSSIVTRTLRYATQPERRDAAPELRAFQSGIENGSDDSIGLVLTHPFGMDAKQLSLYREAGRRFLGGLLGRPPEHAELGRIITVPEALAAARYGLFRLLNGARDQVGERATIICLDIGASTYDVTIIDAETRKSRASQPLPDWSIRGHFGILLGGTDLDAAIARRVIEIVNAAADTPEIASRFAIERNLKATNARIDTSGDRRLRRKQRNFLDALQRAKKDLTNRLLAQAGPYRWTNDFLVVEIGTAALPGSQGDDMAFAILMPESIPGKDEPPARLKIASEAAELACGRDAAGTPYVHLLISPEALRVRRTDHQPFARGSEEVSADEVTEVLGRRIPELAATVAAGFASTGPVWWIVTGRAALWAPIYANIAEIAASNDGRIAEKPYRPTEMKEAVLEGALRLAVEMHLPLMATNPPTIGIVTQSSEGGVPFQPFEGAAQRFDFPAGTPRELVRMLPGLQKIKDAEAMCDAFEAVGLQPWTVLERDIDRPGCARISVEWTRTSRGIEVTVTGDDKPETRRYYGPFREDRIYGQPIL
jgi:hypothetical protein